MNKQFKSEENKQDIIRSTYNLAKYVHENKISDIILLDGSARPAYAPLLKAWKIMYPQEKRPEIYFINPHLFKKAGREVDELNEAGILFDETFTKLAKRKDSNILIYDTCMHSGRTMIPVYEALSMKGYSNLKMGLAQRSDNPFTNYEIDFEALDYFSSNSCTAFGWDKITRKPLFSILSEIKKEFINDASELRNELSDLITKRAIKIIEKEVPDNRSKAEILRAIMDKYLPSDMTYEIPENMFVK